MTRFLDSAQIVLIDIPDDWCLTCKFRKTMALDGISNLDLFQRKAKFQCKATLLTNTIKYISSWYIAI